MRTEAGRQLAPLRRDLLELDDRRERQLRELGAAVYEGDEEAAKRVTEELNRLDERAASRRRRRSTAIAGVSAGAPRKGRLRVQPTVVKPPDDEE